MAHIQTELRSLIRKTLEDSGAKVLSMETRNGGHQCAHFTVAGQTGKFIFASTPSDVRTEKNAVSRARRKVRALLTHADS